MKHRPAVHFMCEGVNDENTAVHNFRRPPQALRCPSKPVRGVAALLSD